VGVLISLWLFLFPIYFDGLKKLEQRIQKCVELRRKGKKGKVVPVLNLIKHYAMKAYGGVDV
jgi:hypothetical protein